MSNQPLTVGLIQHAMDEAPPANRERGAALIRQAAGEGARLIVMPELHTSRYFCQTEDVGAFELGEPIPGPGTEYFAPLARELGVVIVLSLFERRAAGLYHNTAVVLEADGSIAGTYRKHHIPDDPGFYEKFYFTPGEGPFQPIDTSAGRLGVLICWDQWYPEAARLMALAGADLLIYPSAIGWTPEDSGDEKRRQRDAWVTVQRGHAVANGIPVLTTNRVGHEPDPGGATSGIDFWGNSFIAGCQGELIAEAGAGQALLIAELDPRRSEDTRRIWPFLRDRRIECYGDLTRRYRD